MTHELRDLVGYADTPPDASWPGDARIAVNFCLNYEEGAEYCLLNGDSHPETRLSDLHDPGAQPNTRHLCIEENYEFGSRVGFWRVFRLFRERCLPLTLYIVGQALTLNPRVAAAIAETDWDLVGHGWRWIDYYNVPREVERADMRRTVATLERMIGRRPAGWYSGLPSLSTRGLVAEEGFLYHSDCFNDELPYWTLVDGRPLLLVPDALDTQDTHFARARGFDLAEEFCTYMCDTFDWLYAEGARQPRMMTVALHGRLIGRPGRMPGLARFIDHVQRHDKVWICRREDIARHWYARHPFQGPAAGEKP